MAILAESVVEEWLNRKNFFTIRGVKHGVNEIDILAIRLEPNGNVVGWHVEVQVSFRPIGYISQHKDFGYARKRVPEVMADCVEKWIEKKFRAETKRQVRDTLWKGLQWSFHFVHGEVRHKDELELIQSHGVTLHPFYKVLVSLCGDKQEKTFSGSAGGDMAEIITYYEKIKSL